MWPFRTSPRSPLIFCDASSTNAKAAFDSLAVRFTRFPWRADLVWARKGHEAIEPRLRRHQLLNHVPGEREMVDKGRLTTNLMAFDAAARGADLPALGEFYPETFRLRLEGERNALLAKRDTPKNLWILKPTSLSRGRGIIVLWRLSKLKSLFRHPERPHGDLDALRKRDYIAQRYVKDVLLLDGRKSEIRIYWLIACLDPLLVLIYREGTVRLTSKPFKIGDFNNPLVHVTNVYQQKNHPDFDPDVELKWDFPALETYLVEERAMAPPGYLENVLQPALKASLTYVVRSSIDLMGPTCSQSLPFGLYGADYIIDNQLNPWLTEIQLGPGLSHSDSVKRRVVPDMLRETAEIALEVQSRKRCGAPLTALSSVERFEWIINEAD